MTVQATRLPNRSRQFESVGTFPAVLLSNTVRWSIDHISIINVSGSLKV